jgi:thiol:disulfide interchange protein DsbA
LAAQPGAEAAGPDVPRGAEAAPAAAAQATSLDALLERVRVDPRFLAGRDYERLATPVPTGSAPGRIEVCEFFMFGCVHCYALEPELERWALTKPDHVDLVRVPAIFNATARLHAQAFYAAEALGIVDELRGPFYEEIHVAGNKLDTVAAIETFFAEAGIGSAAFRVAFDSAAVRARVERAEELNRLYRVNATPSLAVNGKYLTNAAMAGTADALFEVVDSLVASESAASCGDRDASRCPVR